MTMKQRKPKSPYARHGKAPYKYSEAYQHWKSATSEESRQAADAAFRRVHRIPYWDTDPATGHVKNFKAVRHQQETYG